VKQKKVTDEKASYTSVVPAVEQAARILICLSQNAPSKMNLTDISKEVGIHKSKGYSILNTLQKFGFVQRESEGKFYALGPGLISLGRKVLDSLNLRQVADPFLGELARVTRNTACFGLIADDNVFVVGRQEGDPQMGLAVRIGHRYRITHGAHGKAIAAFMDQAEREKLLARTDLYFHGDPATFDRKRLEREMAKCRLEGYAEDLGEMNTRINTVAAPVFTSGGRVSGVIFVVGLFSKSLVKQYGSLVADAGRKVSQLLGANVEEIYEAAALMKTTRNNPK
jgi:DNA-binding IclR family transcriptional regulator